MKRIQLGAVCAFTALTFSTSVFAQGAPMVSGTVEKVDAAQGRITIDHGPIPNLNMDSMSMVFRTQDPAMLKQVKQGDKVQFSAERVNGQITVTKIQKAK